MQEGQNRKTSSLSILAIAGVEPYQEKPGEEYMNEAQLAHFKRILEAWRNQLRDEVDRTVSHMQDEAANFPDPVDRAAQEEEFSLELRNRDRERKLIKKIEKTLKKVEDEDFGYCESCGVEIGIRRLEARPTADLCIDCKTLAVALIDGMALDGGSTLTQDGKGVNSQVNYTVNSLKLQGQDMGSGKLTLKVDNVDGQAWHQFSQQYSAQSQALLAKPELAQNPELYQQALTETLFNALPILLKGNPSVTISPLSWRNAKGESTLNLSVLLKDPAQVTAPPQTLAESLDRVVQSLDGKVVIPVDMATEFMTKIAGLEGYQPADAAKLADQQVKGLAAMGQMFRITTMEDNAISSSLQYANGQVTLNGQKMPLQDFAAMFGLEAPSLPDSAPQEGQPQQDDAAPQQDDAAPQP